MNEAQALHWTLSPDGTWVCDAFNGHAVLRPLAGPRVTIGYCWQIQIETSHCIQRTVRWFVNDTFARRRVEHDLVQACAEASEAK